MITEPTNKSKEAMEAKTLVVPPKERTIEGGLPSGGEAGQVVTKTADGAEWADVPQELPDLEGSDAGDVLTNIGNNKTAWVANHDVPSGGSAGQVLKKATNQDYACQWGAPTVGLFKSTSAANRFKIIVAENSDYPATGSDTSWTVTGISVPSAIMSIFNSQYQDNEYATGMIGIQIAEVDPEDPDIPISLITKDLRPFNVAYTVDGNFQISFAEFYHVSSSGKLYRIVIDPIDYDEGSWDTQGLSIYVECLMETA